MVLDASLLNTQHYKVRNKGKVEQSRKGVAPSPTPWCSSYRKGNLRVTLDYGRQLYLLICHKTQPNQIQILLAKSITVLIWFNMIWKISLKDIANPYMRIILSLKVGLTKEWLTHLNLEVIPHHRMQIRIIRLTFELIFPFECIKNKSRAILPIPEARSQSSLMIGTKESEIYITNWSSLCDF